MQPSESLYDQKPEELPTTTPTSPSIKNNLLSGSSSTSRFEYMENVQSSYSNSGGGGAHLVRHASLPGSSNFFADFGMDNEFPKKYGLNSNSSIVHVSHILASFTLV